MSEYWQYSFQMSNIPASFIKELKDGLKKIFCTDIEAYFHKTTNTYYIEILDEQVHGNNSFFKYFEDDLKKIIWKYGFLEFEFAIAPIPVIVPRIYTENDYEKFKKSLTWSLDFILIWV